jgi:hypothetical protein
VARAHLTVSLADPLRLLRGSAAMSESAPASRAAASISIAWHLVARRGCCRRRCAEQVRPHPRRMVPGRSPFDSLSGHIPKRK